MRSCAFLGSCYAARKTSAPAGENRHHDITIGPSAVGITFIIVIAGLIALGFVSAEDVAAVASKLRLW
jgi:hypothetical protein